MKISFRVLLLFITTTVFAGATAKTREETIPLFENRKLTVAVPEGFECVSGQDQSGMITLKLADPQEKISGEVKFLPDPEGRFANARARKELMNEMFFDYVESSSEKAMQFEELEPRTGAGTYCVFTDASLVGKTAFPPGEFLHLTAGLKAWPGVVAVFRFFSNETTSAEYQAILKLMRESMQEKPVPLK